MPTHLPSSTRAPVWVAASVVALGLCTSAAQAAPSPPKTITVGTVTLKYCNSTYDGYCGSIKRPLDPTGLVKGNINVGFEFYPHRDQSRPAIGVIFRTHLDMSVAQSSSSAPHSFCQPSVR